MTASLTLKYSPSLLEVSATLRDFTARHGAADIYYSGEVYDSSDGETYRFPGSVAVSRLFPQQDRMILPLLEGFVPWKVAPVGNYSFEIVVRGASPSGRRHVIDADKHWPDWTNSIRPYANASKLESTDTILKVLGFRNPIIVQQEGSIAPEFRSKRRRCGIYVLHFANGEYYVGQTTEIVRRYLQHRNRHKDIIRVSFRPIGRRSLDFHEGLLIQVLETRKIPLRNIKMTSILSAEPSTFDEVMSAEQQQRWLEDTTYIDLNGDRSGEAKERQLYKDRLEQFKRMECYSDVLSVLREYVSNSVPAIKRGEAVFWQLSCLPPTYKVLVRLNINWQEVFFANQDDQGLYFYLCLAKSPLQESFGQNLEKLTEQYTGIEWEDGLYQAGGSDQIVVHVWDTVTANRFVKDPRVIRALRLYNLRLMKRGRCPWSNSHNFRLVEELLK